MVKLPRPPGYPVWPLIEGEGGNVIQMPRGFKKPKKSKGASANNDEGTSRSSSSRVGDENEAPNSRERRKGAAASYSRQKNPRTPPVAQGTKVDRTRTRNSRSRQKVPPAAAAPGALTMALPRLVNPPIDVTFASAGTSSAATQHYGNDSGGTATEGPSSADTSYLLPSVEHIIPPPPPPVEGYYASYTSSNDLPAPTWVNAMACPPSSLEESSPSSSDWSAPGSHGSLAPPRPAYAYPNLMQHGFIGANELEPNYLASLTNMPDLYADQYGQAPQAAWHDPMASGYVPPEFHQHQYGGNFLTVCRSLPVVYSIAEVLDFQPPYEPLFGSVNRAENVNLNIPPTMPSQNYLF